MWEVILPRVTEKTALREKQLSWNLKCKKKLASDGHFSWRNYKSKVLDINGLVHF